MTPPLQDRFCSCIYLTDLIFGSLGLYAIFSGTFLAKGNALCYITSKVMVISILPSFYTVFDLVK